MLSIGQIDQLLNPNKTRSYKWQNEDYIKGMEAKSIGNKKSLLNIRKKCIPLPGESTIRNKFHFISVEPKCFIKPVLIYLKDLMPRLEKVERLAKIAFDETKLSEIAEYDQKLDFAILPHVNVQVLTVSGIIGEKFFFPFYMDWDVSVTKELYEEMIKKMYNIDCTVQITSCDQSTKNQGCSDAKMQTSRKRKVARV